MSVSCSGPDFPICLFRKPVRVPLLGGFLWKTHVLTFTDGGAYPSTSTNFDLTQYDIFFHGMVGTTAAKVYGSAKSLPFTPSVCNSSGRVQSRRQKHCTFTVKLQTHYKASPKQKICQRGLKCQAWLIQTAAGPGVCQTACLEKLCTTPWPGSPEGQPKPDLELTVCKASLL